MPGDIVKIGSGDGVPADCRLCEKDAKPIQVDQAALTVSHARLTFCEQNRTFVVCEDKHVTPQPLLDHRVSRSR